MFEILRFFKTGNNLKHVVFVLYIIFFGYYVCKIKPINYIGKTNF